MEEEGIMDISIHDTDLCKGKDDVEIFENFNVDFLFSEDFLIFFGH